MYVDIYIVYVSIYLCNLLLLYSLICVSTFFFFFFFFFLSICFYFRALNFEEKMKGSSYFLLLFTAVKHLVLYCRFPPLKTVLLCVYYLSLSILKSLHF